MINKWHSWIGMPKYDLQWHENDMADELAEYYEESRWWKRWSEMSDVAYTYTLGHWSGHNIDFPLARRHYYLGLVYMFPKYTGRFLFYRRAARKVGARTELRCVRNPKKLHKLEAVVAENKVEVDLGELKRQCEKQLRYWPLLP